MPWLAVLLFLGVGFILGGSFVWWYLTPTIRLVESDNARLRAENHAVLDRHNQLLTAIGADYNERLARRARGQR